MTQFLAVIQLVAILSVGIGAANAQELPAGGAREQAPRAIAVVPEAEDRAIETRLQSILEASGWFDTPSVSVRNGIVFLDGQTERDEHRDWAERLAESTQGSVAVINRIAVRSDAGTIFGTAVREMRDFFTRVLGAWPVLIVAVFILLAAWLAARLAARLARGILGRRISSPLLLRVVERAFAIPVFLLGVYFVLQVAGLTRLAITLLGGTGILGVVLGFAFRDIAENFLASLLLSLRNPFRSGDLIEVDGRTGIVQNLNTRTTVLLTLEGTHIQIPNAVIYKSTVINYSSNASRRAEFVVGIGYDSSAAKAQAAITEVLERHPAVLAAPEPLVLVDELGEASVNLRVLYWFDTATYSPAKMNSAILRLSKNALQEAGIELPDPAREVIFPKGIPLVDARSGALDATPPEKAPAPAGGDDAAEATTGEGDLGNEAKDVRSRAAGQVPEAAAVNLLKS